MESYYSAFRWCIHLNFTKLTLWLVLCSRVIFSLDLLKIMFTHNTLILSPWQQQSCHSIHHHGNTRAVTQYITMATPELSLNTSPCTPELSLNTSPWQHQSCHSIHQKQCNCYLFEKVTPSKIKISVTLLLT